MPIRTNRGRGAFYRRFWSWPLRSRLHLAAGTVAVVAVLAGVGYLLNIGNGDTAPPAAERTSRSAPTPEWTREGASATSGRRSPTTAAAPDTSLPTAASPAPAAAPAAPAAPADGAVAPLDGGSAEVDPAVTSAARNWAAAWVSGGNREAWLAGLALLSTPEYLGQLDTVDPSSLPATRVTGDPAVVDALQSSATVEVPTDGPTLRLRLLLTDQGWQVADVEPVRR